MLKNKLFIISICILAAMVLGGAMGSAHAYFSDLETSSANTIRTINAWEDLAWHWRRPVTITNNGIPLTDVQVKITADTASIVNEGHMQPDGDDIRFAIPDVTPEIPVWIDYWIESGIDTTSTVIWVKVPYLPAGDSTIYMYYGNTTAAAASNAESVFDLYDDFETDLSDWTEYTDGSGTYTLVTNPVYQGTKSMKVRDSKPSKYYGVYGSLGLPPGTVYMTIQVAARPAQANNNFGIIFSDGVLPSLHNFNPGDIQTETGPIVIFSSDGHIEYFDATWHELQTYNANTWYFFKLVVDLSTDTYDIYVDDVLVGNDVNFAFAQSNLDYVSFLSASGSPTLYVDSLATYERDTSDLPTSVGAEE